MIHTIIVIVLVYAALRALLRRKPADPMVGRLVARDPGTHAQIVSWHEQQHYTFAQRHTVDWNPPVNLISAARERRRIVKERWYAGFATYEEKNAAYDELIALLRTTARADLELGS
jgi:hypothetical protein